MWLCFSGIITIQSTKTNLYPIFDFSISERIKPDKDQKGHHLSMNQFRRLFSSCRIPGPQRDHLNCYFKTGRFIVHSEKNTSLPTNVLSSITP